MNSNYNYIKEEVYFITITKVTCRICMNEEETSRFIVPCACKGSL